MASFDALVTSAPDVVATWRDGDAGRLRFVPRKRRDQAEGGEPAPAAGR